MSPRCRAARWPWDGSRPSGGVSQQECALRASEHPVADSPVGHPAVILICVPPDGRDGPAEPEPALTGSPLLSSLLSFGQFREPLTNARALRSAAVMDQRRTCHRSTLDLPARPPAPSASGSSSSSSLPVRLKACRALSPKLRASSTTSETSESSLWPTSRSSSPSRQVRPLCLVRPPRPP